MALKNSRIAQMNPGSKANRAFIQAVYREKFGRNATEREITRFLNQTVKDVSNIILRDASPFKSAGQPSSTPTGEQLTDVSTGTKYQGKGGTFGELPKRDASGKYSWINADGTVTNQDGYNPATGSWEYLGDHLPNEWTAAETIYRSQPLIGQPFSSMNDQQKLAFLNQAHLELGRSLVNDVATGQTSLLYESGNAIKTFADSLKTNNIGIQDDIRKITSAMEASGLTFTGFSKRQLGEVLSGSGAATADQVAKFQQNLKNIYSRPESATTGGAATTNVPMPQRLKDILNNTALTEDQKQGQLEQYYNTDEYKQYVADLNKLATSGTGEGVAGTGQYGYSGNLDPYSGTGLTSAAAQGSLFMNASGTGRTQIAESFRNDFNRRARELGTAAESLLGSSNIGAMPSFGGQSIFTPAANVLGSLQRGYQANLGTRAGELAGNAINQQAYFFNI